MAQLKQTRFLQDLIWNYGSVAILAVGGFLFSGIIIFFYDAAVLGVFNLVYAYYLLLSQLSVFGLHMSVSKYAAEHSFNTVERRRILFGGLSWGFLLSLVVCVVYAAGLWSFGEYMRLNLLNGLWSLVLALPFFTINKIILGFINGISEMRIYALLQALRNVFIATTLVILAILGVSGYYISICFFVAELLLFAVSFFYLLHKKYFVIDGCQWLTLGKKQLLFGFRILPGNLVLEFNTKIDIICLGWILASDILVGYYSFASLFIEGFYLLFVVVRRNINPQITQYFLQTDWTVKFTHLRNIAKKYLRWYSFPLAALLIAGYYLFCVLFGLEGYIQAMIPLGIVVGSIALNSRSIVFGNILAQTGYPSQESLVNICTAGTNLVLNLLFISLWGLLGAALATGFSYFVFSALLRYHIKKKLSVTI